MVFSTIQLLIPTFSSAEHVLQKLLIIGLIPEAMYVSHEVVVELQYRIQLPIPKMLNCLSLRR